MLNTILSAWVKIVYTRYNNWFTNSDVSSPTSLTYYASDPAINVQLPVYRPFLTNLGDLLSTTKNANLHLLNNYYAHNPQALLLRTLKRI
jgi:hypothetical protein